jgi:Mn2+/Fe2+ NRAMP family transporter
LDQFLTHFAGHRAGAFSHTITTFVVGTDWGRVTRDTLAPSLPHTRDECSTLAAIRGTTISPYLFFRQASEEVEVDKAAGQSTLAKHPYSPMQVNFGTGLTVSEFVFIPSSFEQSSPICET